jgi:predicted Zn-dependent protease
MLRLLAVAAPLIAAASPALAAAPPCPLAEERRASISASAVLLPPATTTGSGSAGDYRHRLSSTPLGWPRLDRWCVWVEPVSAEGPGQRWESIWLQAVERALDSWATAVPFARVDDPEAAQIRIERRRPPLRIGADGRSRASHGRASLELLEVRRDGRWRLEPDVTVQLGSGQRPEALQATALHELGHAFGLWGHSDGGDDAMAAAPGPLPVLELTARDRATVQWLYRQPTRFGAPLPSND